MRAHARAVILCIVLVPTAAVAQVFSPGELAKPHAPLEGIRNCTKCHEEGKQLSADKCLACHTELRGRVAGGRGFHGRLPQADRTTCQKCHKDHEGRGFKMIDWGAGGEAKFDHKRTGFALQGKHAALECASCHEPRLIADGGIKALIKREPGRKTFLGLSTKCADCHFDEHRGQEGKDCGKCHGESAWKPARAFDHGKTAYPLTGKHADVACAKCHPAQRDDKAVAGAFPAPRAATFAKFAGVAHGACTDCHTDPHKGQLGANCSSCHDTAGWSRIKGGGGGGGGSAAAVTFHDKTRYPLRGRHADVACKACHGPFPGEPARYKGLAFGKCTDCHADAHFGQLASAGEPAPGKGSTGAAPSPGPKGKAATGRKGAVAHAAGDCAGCHTVEGFTPTRFEAEDHADTRFPLEQAHAAVACRKCHPQDEPLARRTFASMRAASKGARATRLSFAVLRPSGRTDQCESCHKDPHGGQLKGRAGQQGCPACHKPTSFGDVSFDHGKDTRFPLAGKHAATACAACHPHAPPATPGGPPGLVVYKPRPTTCAGCHADVHYGQFAALGAAGAPSTPADCGRCHDTQDFKKTSFSHADRRFTSFALDGKHDKVACAGCHRTVALGGGVEVVRYKPVPTACEGCHEDVHKGAYRRFTP